MAVFKSILFLIFFMLITPCGQVLALQQSPAKIDSLRALLTNTDDKTTRVDILNDISDYYMRINPTLADSCNRQGMTLAEKLGYNKGIAQSAYNAYIYNKNLGNIELALINIRKAKEFQLICQDSGAYANCLINEATMLMKKQEFKNAFELLLQARDLYESGNLNGDIALLYNNLGQVSHQLEKYSEALRYHEKSLVINLQKHFDRGVSVNYVNIGNVYHAQKNYPKAIEFYAKALEIKRKIDDKSGILKCLNNLGVVYMYLNNLQQALTYHQQALDYALVLGNNPDIAMCYINIGYDYQQAKAFNDAIRYTLKGFEIAEKCKDTKLLKDASLLLSESYASRQQFPEAYHYHLQFKQFDDSLTNDLNLKELHEIETKYASSQKDIQIKELLISTADQELRLQREKVYVMLFIGLFILVTVLVVFFYQQSKNARKVQSKLQEINDIKSAFFANLSHEFRTPLALMLGPAEKLLEKAEPTEKPLLQLIHRNASRLLALDEQLLEFTRIDSGNQQLKLAKGDIISLISAIVASFSLPAQKKNIVIEQVYFSEKLYMLFDPDIIEKVVGNLISNAVKYTQSGGNIKINISEADSKGKSDLQDANFVGQEMFCIEVSDNGTGIPLEKQQLIFERFYQLNNYTGGVFDGYGIGLALVRELVQLHKGKILVQSAVGAGSTFSVFLPRHTAAYNAEELKRIETFTNQHLPVIMREPLEYESTETKNPMQPAGNDSRIITMLVVDDNPDMRVYLTEILQDTYQILEAADGKEGLKIARLQLPNLVITDIMMETMDGIEFCKRLKTNKKTQHIPVIMLTALTTLDDKIAGLENGADDYMVKPFNAKELMARIGNLIAQRKFLKDLFTKELKIEPHDISINSAEAVFLHKLIGIIENNIENPDMEAGFLAKKIGMSRSQLYRRITNLTKQPACSFIKIIRIKRAAQLMQQHTGNISEIMYSVGFNNLSYFSKCFREVYLMTPSEYINSLQEKHSA